MPNMYTHQPKEEEKIKLAGVVTKACIVSKAVRKEETGLPLGKISSVPSPFYSHPASLVLQKFSLSEPISVAFEADREVKREGEVRGGRW